MSLFTKRVPEDKLDRVFACLRTPIQENEPHLAPFTLPEGVEPGPRRPLFSHSSLEILVPSRTSVGGFLISWTAVALLIWGFYAITR